VKSDELISLKLAGVGSIVFGAFYGLAKLMADWVTLDQVSEVDIKDYQFNE
jgi:hypothetical protein